MDSVVSKVMTIAKRDLRRCYARMGIMAGGHQFSEYWAWDSMLASFGMRAMGDNDVAEKNLRLYLEQMNTQGQIPYRFGTWWGLIVKLFGWPDVGRVQPRYNLHLLFFVGTGRGWSSGISKLPNVMALVSLGEHKQLQRQYKGEINKMVVWLSSQEKRGLIWESWHENRTDSVRSEGWSLFTNVCYWRGLKAVGQTGKAKKVQQFIQQRFWKGEYLASWVTEGKRAEYFSTDGNMLAVWWGLVGREQGKKILAKFKQLKLTEPVPAVNVARNSLPKEWIPNRFRAIGMPDYHDYTVGWLWLGCVAAMAANKIDSKYARQLVADMARVIVRDGEVYETYDRDGWPVKRLIYKSEHPFAWSAGLFVRAVKELRLK